MGRVSGLAFKRALPQGIPERRQPLEQISVLCATGDRLTCE